jgi:hypothetical protein
MILDFGLYDLATNDRPWPTYRLPLALVELAGKHHIEIELSFYGPGKAAKASRSAKRSEISRPATAG